MRRKGFSVAIKRKDGSEFLACGSRGVLPSVFIERRWAVQHKRELIAENFKCRVVPVFWSAVTIRRTHSK